MSRGIVILFLILTSSLVNRGEDLVGSPAPEWHFTNWINSTDLKLADLRGKVVLVRWWTAPGCPYCGATAPALNEFHEKYQGEGFQVIAAYHHKARGPIDLKRVARSAKEIGFNFPVTIDPEWKTLREWHLNRADQGWTSVSFLLDRKGVVRLIHPGGQYVKGDGHYEEIDARIRQLLRESK